MAQILYYITAIESIFEKLGFVLELEQPHLSEEGLLLMRDKRVLIGRRQSDGAKVIIKASNSPGGRKEIESEKVAQDILSTATFTTSSLHFPAELYYGEQSGYLIRVTEFIEQKKVFAALPLDEQFFIAMKAFEAQESFYANTFEHIGIISKVFPVSHAEDYIARFEKFKINDHKKTALRLLRNNKELIETRSNYLTHTDFAPSNFRIHDQQIYMIDLSSIHFGNRYEGLARLTNYSIVHSPKLGSIITDYIKKNRGEDEYLCLRLMRIYKAGFLINHYSEMLTKTEGNLQQLTEKRLVLWHEILGHLIEDTPIPASLIDSYKMERAFLRSERELERQKQFNLL